MNVHVNIQMDFSLGVLSHWAITPPMPTAVINVSVEMFALQFWIYGYAANQNKFAKKVVHKNQWIVQNGHDCGMLIPDVTFPIFPNLLYTVMWPFSSRKITFAASTVQMEKQATGCAQLIGLPPLPMMTCGDPVSAPTAVVPLNVLNNVTVGMTLGDFFIGLFSIALSMAIDFIFHKIGGGKAPSGSSAWNVVGKEFLGKLVPTSPEALLKKGVSAAAGLLTSALQGNPTWTFSIGAPFLGGQVSIDSNGLSGQGSVLGWQRDTRGGGANWGSSL